MIILTIAVFIFILGVLVFVHELGHFIAAKRAGMKVEEFGFGFPPRMFGVRRGETVYSVNWIPLGGFVKITGEESGTSTDPRAFSSKSFSSRLKVLVAGVLMNFILAFVIIFFGFWLIGTPAEVDQGLPFANKAIITNREIAIIAVEPGSPADAAGFQSGDQILAVDGKNFSTMVEMIYYTKSRAGNPVVFELKRGKQVMNDTVVPRTNPGPNQGPVGFSPAEVGTVKFPFVEAGRMAANSFASKALLIFQALGALIQKLVSQGQLIQGLSGPVGVAFLTRDFISLGMIYLIQFAATLSINLGVINIFPFPALDGGRVFFLLIEKIRGKASVKWEAIANFAGFMLLILLMVVVTFHDISRYSIQFKNFFGNIF